MTASETDLLTELHTCETRVWDALVRGDMQADSAALDAGFLGVYPDGFAGKDAHVAQLADGPTIARFDLSDARVKALGRDFAVFSYRADYVRTGQTAPETMYVSSIWQRHGAGWINVFSQDTPARG
ncbi:nuclear transport factor 2 family protein [uncultured Sulfitobacter sp.]|uniref:nuclear transport factor 2 family protein n=1 Tax=uncultured Sulfitobacter sp. TaxID=191468 RepID=UPI00260BBF2C|nr:nuclear transport factor 2 family protein [uncultured Sulfitobacter sp.]